MTLLFTIPAFALFVLYVEGSAIRSRLNVFKKQIDHTFGRAEWVHPTVRSRQAWMRTNVVKSYTK